MINSGRGSVIALAFGGFVAAEVFLGFGEDHVLAELGAVLLQAELVRGVHGIFGRVINALSGFLGDHTNDLTLVAFFCHRLMILTD